MDRARGEHDQQHGMSPMLVRIRESINGEDQHRRFSLAEVYTKIVSPQCDTNTVPFVVPRRIHHRLCSNDRIKSDSQLMQRKNGNLSPLSLHRTDPNEVCSSNSQLEKAIRKIDPSLYANAGSEGDLRIYPDGHVGRVWFTLEYDTSRQRLRITLVKARNLLAHKVYITKATGDLVFRLTILPDESSTQEMRTRRNIQNTNLNEVFTFTIASTVFDDSRLKITVYDCENNALKHYIPIGSIIFPLREYTFCKQQKLIVWRDLKRHIQEETAGKCGEIHVMLNYNGGSERLFVKILAAKDLRVDESVAKDTYAILTLQIGKKILKTKRTKAVKNSRNPEYNEMFEFKITAYDLLNCRLTISAVQCKNDRQIGRLHLGDHDDYPPPSLIASSNATTIMPLNHWKTMVSRPGELIEEWHYLVE